MNLSKIFLSLLLPLFMHLTANATWSIIVIDARTNEIGIAGASCTMNVYGIGLIVPGKGAIVVQAMSNALARMEGFNMIMNGVSSSEILQKLKHPDYDPEEQQYAVLTRAGISQAATYTGTENHPHSGALTGYGISVQGNTLANADVLKAVYDGAVKAQKDSLPIQEVLMLALEAGAKKGGDKRCGERKASSAFVMVSKPGDVDEYWLKLVVRGSDENKPAVEALRTKYNSWKSNNRS